MRVVLDTNVLIAGILTPRGTAARVVRAALAGQYVLVTTPALLAELKDVLRRKFPRLWAREGRGFLALLERRAQIVSPTGVRVTLNIDPADAAVLEAGVAGCDR